MNMNGIYLIILQIAAISASSAMIYGFQKWINSNLEIDKENVAAVEQARMLRRQETQYTLEMAQATELTELPPLEFPFHAATGR